MSDQYKAPHRPRLAQDTDCLYHIPARNYLESTKRMIRRGYVKFWRKRGMQPPVVGMQYLEVGK